MNIEASITETLIKCAQCGCLTQHLEGKENINSFLKAESDSGRTCKIRSGNSRPHLLCFPKFRFRFLFFKLDAAWSFSASLPCFCQFGWLEEGNLWNLTKRVQKTHGRVDGTELFKLSNFYNIMMLSNETVLSVWTMMNRVSKRKPACVIPLSCCLNKATDGMLP